MTLNPSYEHSRCLYDRLRTLEEQRSKLLFVARKCSILKGSEHVGTMISKTLAKRVANLLNRYPANQKGE